MNRYQASTSSVGQKKSYSSPYSNSYSKDQPRSMPAATSVAQRKSCFSSSSNMYAKNQPPSTSATTGSLPRSGNSGVVHRATTKPTRSSQSRERMFEHLYDGKAEVQILDSHEDDKLAASIYGATQRSPTKRKRDSLTTSSSTKEGVSGYDFDSLIKDNDDDESTDGHDSFQSASWE